MSRMSKSVEHCSFAKEEETTVLAKPRANMSTTVGVTVESVFNNASEIHSMILHLFGLSFWRVIQEEESPQHSLNCSVFSKTDTTAGSRYDSKDIFLPLRPRSYILKYSELIPAIYDAISSGATEKNSIYTSSSKKGVGLMSK